MLRRVTLPLRRSSLVLLWLLLALLPLRGWANLTMHLPSPDSVAVMPCHGPEAQAADVAADGTDAPRPARCAMSATAWCCTTMRRKA